LRDVEGQIVDVAVQVRTVEVVQDGWYVLDPEIAYAHLREDIDGLSRMVHCFVYVNTVFVGA
jgi:hypothetical protein